MASTGRPLPAVADRQPLAPAGTYLAGAAVERLLRGGHLAGHGPARLDGQRLDRRSRRTGRDRDRRAGREHPGISQHISQTAFVTFLASVGSLVLTFLAGAEIDPVSLRGHWKASVSIGLVSFALPFLAAFGFCKLA